MDRRGRMTVSEIIAAYAAFPITIVEPSLLIIVNRLLERNISAERLYEITRGNWVLGEHRCNVNMPSPYIAGWSGRCIRSIIGSLPRRETRTRSIKTVGALVAS